LFIEATNAVTFTAVVFVSSALTTSDCDRLLELGRVLARFFARTWIRDTFDTV